MSRNNVRGPGSALTEFLRDSGITATTVARRLAATQPQPVAGPSNAEQSTDADPAEPEENNSPGTRRRTRGNNATGYASDELDEPESPPKKQKLSKAAQAKLKAKAKKKAGEDDDYHDEDEDNYTALSKSMWSNSASSSSKPPVGSFEICSKCEKQFTVTKYTMAANPGPGFLCHPCAKSSGSDPFKKPAVPKKRKAPAERRTIVNIEQPRFPSLVSLCIQIISRHINDIEAFGDIGAINMEGISKAISKNRSLTSENAHLFYGPENTTLTLYDATKLSPTALTTLGYLNPNLTTLRLDFCGLISDAVLASWSTSLPKLTSLQLLGPFLVRVPAWIAFFKSHTNLESFLITQSPRFDVECISALVETSSGRLRRLGLVEIGKMCDEFLEHIKLLSGQLSYLDISEPAISCSAEAITDLLSVVGPTLTHLNLSNHDLITDNVLELGIKPHAKALTSLSLSLVPDITNSGVAQFFSANSNPPFASIDLSRNPLLSTEALLAILAHSGKTLQDLNINGWKDTEGTALAQIGKEARDLRVVDLGWCREVDDFVVKDLLEGSKGYLKEVKVWGCNRVQGKWTVNGTRTQRARVLGIETQSV